jgi:hypothetical protein
VGGGFPVGILAGIAALAIVALGVTVLVKRRG